MREFQEEPIIRNIPSFADQIMKMSKMYDAVGLEPENTMSDEDRELAGPLTMDLNPRLKAFEAALAQTLEVTGDDRTQIEFNKALDKEIARWKSEEETSVASYYKRFIGNTLRFNGSVKLETVYNNIEESVGEGKVDGKLFHEAWEEIKDYLEKNLPKSTE